MKSILNELPDDESILLLYLANELPSGDRQKVEQRLAADGELRAKLQELSQLRDFCQNSIRSLDEHESGEHMESAAMRRAGRMLQQWALRRRRPAEAAPQIARSIPWLRYGLSAAAMMGLVYLVWWSNHPVAPITDQIVDSVNTGDQAPPADAADTLSPEVKLSMLLNTMDASAADDVPDRQVVALGVKSDDINFSVDLPPAGNSQ